MVTLRAGQRTCDDIQFLAWNLTGVMQLADHMTITYVKSILHLIKTQIHV